MGFLSPRPSIVPVLEVAVSGEPAHDGGVLDVHPLEDGLGDVAVLAVLLVELVGEAEVVQLPRVGRQVEGVEVRALPVPDRH